MTDSLSQPGLSSRPPDEHHPAAAASRSPVARWSDPAFIVGTSTLVGVLFYAILPTAVARFYAPLGASADDVNATYPGLLAVSATTLGVLLTLTAALVATFLLYGWAVAWLFAQGRAASNRLFAPCFRLWEPLSPSSSCCSRGTRAGCSWPRCSPSASD